MPEVKILDHRIPGGQYARIDGVGKIHYRDNGKSDKAHTILLIHGIITGSAMNWMAVFEPLGRHFRVIAPDLRGHGDTTHEEDGFELGRAADDIAALLEHLGIEHVIAVGYSLGGPVAQQLWKRHRHYVEGLVMAATGPGGHLDRLPLPAGLIDLMIEFFRRREARKDSESKTIPRAERDREQDELDNQWAISQLRQLKPHTMLEATRELMNYDFSEWLEEVDVPSCILVTVRDRVFSLSHQQDMARKIPDARAHHFDGGHVSVLKSDFSRALLSSCMDVASRVDRTGRYGH